MAVVQPSMMVFRFVRWTGLADERVDMMFGRGDSWLCVLQRRVLARCLAQERVGKVPGTGEGLWFAWQRGKGWPCSWQRTQGPHLSLPTQSRAGQE